MNHKFQNVSSTTRDISTITHKCPCLWQTGPCVGSRSYTLKPFLNNTCQLRWTFEEAKKERKIAFIFATPCLQGTHTSVYTHEAQQYQYSTEATLGCSASLKGTVINCNRRGGEMKLSQGHTTILWCTFDEKYEQVCPLKNYHDVYDWWSIEQLPAWHYFIFLIKW